MACATDAIHSAKRCAARRSRGTWPDARGHGSYNPLMPVRLGIERLLDGPDRKSDRRQACRPRLQPSLDRQPHRPRLRSSDGGRLAPPDCAVRPAARLPVRSPGEHDRVAARARREAARAGAFALQRNARADRGDAQPASTCSSSICRMSARGSTPTSTRWPTACAPRSRHGVHVVVCDRPNPINGHDIEGATLDPAYESFVGQFAIPMRHGLTIGEAARLFNEHFGLNAAARRRPDRGLDAIDVLRRDGTAVGAAVAQHPDARHRGRLSGRGALRGHAPVGRTRDDPSVRTDRSAVDRRRAFRRRDERRGIPGAYFRPVFFEPTFHKHAQALCGGCQIHVTDRACLAVDAHRDRDARRVQARSAVAAALARSAVRVRTRQAADRHPLRLGRTADGDRRRRIAGVDHEELEVGRRGVPRLREKFLLY